MKSKWIGKKINNELIKEIKEKLNTGLIVSGIISNRFEDKYMNIYSENIKEQDPMKLPDIDLAVDRIMDAIDSEEKILIYGDYDADGATATAIIYSFLKDLRIRAKLLYTKQIDRWIWTKCG